MGLEKGSMLRSSMNRIIQTYIYSSLSKGSLGCRTVLGAVQCSLSTDGGTKYLVNRVVGWARQ